MFEDLNLYLFSLFNAQSGLQGWPLLGATIAAEWLIMLVPFALVMLWLGGSPDQREVAVRATLAATCGLALNALIAGMWFHPRPFMARVGHTFLQHAPDGSFPSDHATIMLSVALVLAASTVPLARRFGALLLPLALATAWARVYLGVHFPMDMVGALMVASAMALLFNQRNIAAGCAAPVPMMETIYRRALAAPIARGWLRP